MKEEAGAEDRAERARRGTLDGLSDEGAIVFSYLEGQDLARATIAWPREQLQRAVTLMLRQGGSPLGVARALPYLPRAPIPRSAQWLLESLSRGYHQGRYMPPQYQVSMACDRVFQFTTAHWAAQHNRPDLILAMVRSGLAPAVLMRRDSRDHTPGDIAAQDGHARVIGALLQGGVPPAAFIAPCALHSLGCAGLAVRGNHGAVIHVLGRGGVDLTTQDADGYNLAQLAAQENRPDMIELLGRVLRECGHPPATLMVRNRQGYHAAALAALFDRPDAIQALLRAGVTPAELMAEGPAHSTCLHVAAERGHARFVGILAHAAVDLDARDGGGWAAVHRGAEGGHAGVIGALYEAHADMNAAGPRGVVATHLAVQGRHLGAIDALRAVGASFDLPDFDGRTARAIAAMQGLTSALPPATPLRAMTKLHSPN